MCIVNGWWWWWWKLYTSVSLTRVRTSIFVSTSPTTALCTCYFRDFHRDTFFSGECEEMFFSFFNLFCSHANPIFKWGIRCSAACVSPSSVWFCVSCFFFVSENIFFYAELCIFAYIREYLEYGNGQQQNIFQSILIDWKEIKLSTISFHASTQLVRAKYIMFRTRRVVRLPGRKMNAKIKFSWLPIVTFRLALIARNLLLPSSSRSNSLSLLISFASIRSAPILNVAGCCCCGGDDFDFNGLWSLKICELEKTARISGAKLTFAIWISRRHSPSWILVLQESCEGCNKLWEKFTRSFTYWRRCFVACELVERWLADYYSQELRHSSYRDHFYEHTRPRSDRNLLYVWIK